MKFVYTLLHQYIPKINNSLSNVSKEIAKAMNCPGYKPLVSYEPEYDDVVVGGVFVPEDKTSLLNLTSEFLVRENQDKANANLCYLASFTGDNIMDPKLSSYGDKINTIGKWSDNIDANANIYYVIVDNQIRKIIFSKPIEFGKPTDIFGIINIIEDNGDMVYCLPDEGDILFDNLPEAKKYIKENCNLYTPLT